MKILVFPDIHGRTFWHKPFTELIESVDGCVFLGDYVDPYSHEGISNEDALVNLQDIISTVTPYHEKCVMLAGNHDLHYIDDMFYDYARGSRYSNFFARRYGEQLNMLNTVYAHMIHGRDIDILFTHAGINKHWFMHHQDKEINEGDIILFPNDELFEHYDECYKNKSIADILNETHDTPKFRALCEIGRYRGGYDYAGGPEWNDISEISFTDGGNLPYSKNVFQIFGHTQLRDAIILENFACIDCHHAFLLDTNTLKLEKL